jgi:aerobic carbon-monoxide dehydrogenase small subunit
LSTRAVAFELNGEPVAALAKPLESLQSVLRTQLGMTGTKAGCRQGGCGSCTVHVDGEPALSCLVPVEHVEGRAVTTIEGLGTPEDPSPVQAAFHEGFASQCGFCSPGMIAVVTALLERNPDPSREEIGEALAGNVCRCTGLAPIVAAVEDAAARLREREGAAA